jgi:type IV pilus assembly protein PilY1
MRSPLIVRWLERALPLSAAVPLLCAVLMPVPADAALTDIAPAPLANSSTAVVKPNLMFILDESGSMGWRYMPDSVNDDSLCKASSGLRQCTNDGDPALYSRDMNGVYYNPDVTYTPAANADGTSKQSYNTSTLWQSVPVDAYGKQSTSTVNIETGYPDTVWCNTSSPTTAQRTPPFTSSSVCRLPIQNGVWTYPDGTFSRKFSVLGTTRNAFYYLISSLTWCNSQNAQGFGTGTCQAKKTSTYQYPKYGPSGNNGFTRVDIVSGQSYPRSASRTDCTGAVGPTGCSYAEEMTNFANWYAYYHTRLQMMKTAAGNAFKSIDSRYRVGFITINPGNPVSSSNYLGISDFNAGGGSQKENWYKIFYDQTPGSYTPLREALARVGRYFGGKHDGINDGMDDDPIQYSCQQNFAILSTDGFWNTNNETVGPVTLNYQPGNVLVGNQDSNLATAPRPLYDGGNAHTETVTVTTTLQQAACSKNNSVLGTTCGCSTGQNRIKQSTIQTTRTIQSVNGVVTSDQTVTNPGYPTYQNITACSSSTSITALNAQIAATFNPNPQSTSTSTTSNVSGYPNTLADVAQYYYMTDLRANGSLGAPVGSPAVQLDVGINNVPGLSSTDPQNDSANWQHMTTFTLGLGVDGTLTYQPDYKDSPTGDFAAIKSGTLNWPQPVADTLTAVDDLWHAAVNGRGKYFSARNPTQLSSGLAEALSGVNAVVGAAAAAATSNLEPVAGDNFAYIASYETVRWNGEVEARSIDLNTGDVSATDVWSAQAQLDTLTNATSPGGQNRTIKRMNTGSTNGLQDFTWANLTSAEQNYFKSPYISGGTGALYPALSQWGSLSATDQANAQGVNLVNFLRGDSTNEVTLYRDRLHVLGDIVDAQPVYVKKTAANYADAGFSAFKACVNDGGASCGGIFNGPRAATVYISANDGMLHALNGDTGAERWAFIPNIVLPKLYLLADKDYANRHVFTVDGSPTVGDIYDPTSGKWRTILVSGLNSGGRGYYALDVTDPATPIALWEFNVRSTASCPHAVVLGVDKDDCDLGFTYGNPVITKLSDGTWVVVVSSGYNNVTPGDGKGYLYVLNPVTGVILKKIRAENTAQGISPGDTSTPAGIARINNWVNDTTVDNTTLRVYGGDLRGNVWRFNLDDGTAYVIAQLKDPSNVAQPVTTKPELGEVKGKAMIYIPTGEYLGTTDLPSTQVQTIYGIKDDTNGTAPSSPIDARGTSVKPQTLTGDPVRTVTSNPVDVTVAGVNGWRVDLPVSGERVNIDPKLQLGTLIVGSNVPRATACDPGGVSYLNYLDYSTGSYVPSGTAGLAGEKVAGGLLVGLNVVRLPNNKTVVIATTSDNKHPTLYPPFSTSNPTGRRVGWRELVE